MTTYFSGSRSKLIVTILIAFILVTFSASISLAQNPLQFTINENTVTLDAGQRPLWAYRYESVPFKPYIQKFYTPGGINILRDAPHDHLHHHALMYAVAVDGVNFWEEHKAPGRQKNLALQDFIIDQKNGIPQAKFTQKLDWIKPDTNEILIKETRTVESQLWQNQQVSLINWQTQLSHPDRKTPIKISGGHYYGLGMRFLVSMDKDGTFFNADNRPGTIFHGDQRLTKSNWCAYTARADGKEVTVAMFDHPDNPRPVTWFTMHTPFAYLSATLNLHKEPLILQPGQSLIVCYGVVLWDGKIDRQKVGEVYQQWLKRAPKVKTIQSK